MKWLVGKYFCNKSSYGGLVHFYKILDVCEASKSGDPRFLTLDIMGRRLSINNFTMIRDWSLCVSLKADKVDLVTCNGYTLYVMDHYLHRMGGPAYISGDKKEYYLLGTKISKEEYLNVMPEDIQTKMCFEINKV